MHPLIEALAMPRIARISIDGMIAHSLNRGNRRQAVFPKVASFIEALAGAGQRLPWERPNSPGEGSALAQKSGRPCGMSCRRLICHKPLINGMLSRLLLSGPLVRIIPPHPPFPREISMSCDKDQAVFVGQQSPIDFGLAEQFQCDYPPGYLMVDWQPDAIGVLKGHGEQAQYNFENMSSTTGVSLAGQFFPLIQMHFHKGSEHKINGKGADAELHIVHKRTETPDENSQYVVLGIWVKAGQGKPEVDQFFIELSQRLKAFKTKNKTKDATKPHKLNPNHLMPDNRSEFYRYQGSLTTCIEYTNVETVQWVFYRHVLRVTKSVLDGYLKVAHEAKSPQEVNRRFVIRNFSLPAVADTLEA